MVTHTGRRRRGRALSAVLAMVFVSSVASAPDAPPSVAGAVYRDPSYSPAERAADLVSRMTLAEKASQMISSRAAAIPRLGIREYGWWNEAIHGVAREGLLDGENPPTLLNTTSYPVSLSLGATWDPALVHRVASAIGDEAREVVRDNALDLTFYSPTVNLARDPRWGRNDETYGEDPLLTAALGAQYVNGMEGKDTYGRLLSGYLKTATTLKHYAANNSEVNRRSGSSDMDERTLREYYTAQFRDIVRRSAPASIMTAYNRVNGVPASASGHLLRTLGRQTFGFTGYYTSDCDSIFEMQAGHAWVPPGAAAPVDEVSRHALANAAGVDLNCQLGYHDEDNYATSLPDAVRDRTPTELGPYNEAYLDASLVRLFTTRFALGEFDADVPWVRAARARVPAGTWVNTDLNRAVTQTPQRLALAREAAGQATVLLRNDGLLPLSVPATGRYRVAVLGSPDTMYLGGYSSIQAPAGQANQVDAVAGLTAAVRAVNPAATVDRLASVTADLRGYDVVVVVAGTDQRTAAEDTDRADLSLRDDQLTLIRDAVARNPRTVVALETIGPVDVSSFASTVPALLWNSYNGQRKGEALADVLLGAVNPSGRLPFTWYRDDSALPPITDYAIRPAGGAPGRTYQYFAGRPTFPFGYGLSYTTFRYADAKVDRSRLTADDTVTVSVSVTNTGRVAGAEVVQLYATSPPAKERPARRLVGFAKVRVEPGRTERVSLPVRVRDLAFFDEAAGRFVVDPGRYVFAFGPSSAEPRARATVEVSGALTPVPVTASVLPRAATDPAGGPGRVAFPTGVAIEPQLTVAVADDTLYGYVGPGASRPLPPGMSVTYASNRPAVVRADGATLHTVGPGVATVTATVTHHGTTVTTTFVVTVRAP